MDFCIHISTSTLYEGELSNSCDYSYSDVSYWLVTLQQPTYLPQPQSTGEYNKYMDYSLHYNKATYR